MTDLGVFVCLCQLGVQVNKGHLNDENVQIIVCLVMHFWFVVVLIARLIVCITFLLVVLFFTAELLILALMPDQINPLPGLGILASLIVAGALCSFSAIAN